MSSRTRMIVLLTLGLSVAAGSPLIPGIADRLSAPPVTRTDSNIVPSISSPAIRDRASSRMSVPVTRTARDNTPSVPPWDILRGPTTSRPDTRPAANPASFRIPAWHEVLAQSTPKARELFDSGMAYLRGGEYFKARLAFQTLIRTYPGDKAEPLAYWAMALAYCKEGGYENNLLAIDHFKNYLIFFPAEPELEEFAEAAQINVSTLGIQIMNSAPNDKSRLWAAELSAQALTQYLKQYPDSSGVPAAQNQLKVIRVYLTLVGAK